MPLPWLIGEAVVALGKVAYDAYQESEEEEERARSRERDRERAREREREAKNQQALEAKESIVSYTKSSLINLQQQHANAVTKILPSISSFEEVKNIIDSNKTYVEKIGLMLNCTPEMQVESNLKGEIEKLKKEILELDQLEAWIKQLNAK